MSKKVVIAIIVIVVVLVAVFMETQINHTIFCRADYVVVGHPIPAA